MQRYLLSSLLCFRAILAIPTLSERHESSSLAPDQFVSAATVTASNTSSATVYASQCNTLTTGSTPLCVAVNLPTENDAVEDMYFKITGSANSSYTGVGFAGNMTNALMLLIFPTTDSLSVSMRLSVNHSRPSLAMSTITAELLDGSSSDGKTFIANVRCRNCRTWSTGKINQDGAQAFIYAYGQTSTSADVTGDKAVTTYHGANSRGQFRLDLSTAKGTGGVPQSSGKLAVNSVDKVADMLVKYVGRWKSS